MATLSPERLLALVEQCRNQPKEKERLLAILKAAAPQWFEMARRKQSSPLHDRVRAILGARLRELDSAQGASVKSVQGGAPKQQQSPEQLAQLRKRAEEKVAAVRKLATAQLAAHRASQGSSAAPKSAPAAPAAALTPQVRAKVMSNVVAAHKRAQAAVAAQRASAPGTRAAAPINAGAYLPGGPGGYVARTIPLTPDIRARVTPHVVAAHKRAQAATAAQRAKAPQPRAASLPAINAGAYVATTIPLTPEIRAKVTQQVVAAHKRAQAATQTKVAKAPVNAGAYLPGGPGGYVAKPLTLTPEIRAKVTPHVVAAHKRAQAATAAQRAKAPQPRAASLPAINAGAYVATTIPLTPEIRAKVTQQVVAAHKRAQAATQTKVVKAPVNVGAYLPGGPGGYVAKPLTLTPEIRAKVTPHVVAAHKRAQAAVQAQPRAAQVPVNVGAYLPGGPGGYVARTIPLTPDIRAKVTQHVVAAHKRAQAAVQAQPGRTAQVPVNVGAYLPGGPGGYVARQIPLTPEIRARVTPHVIAAHKHAQVAMKARQRAAAQIANVRRGAGKQQGGQKQTPAPSDDKKPGEGAPSPATASEPIEQLTAPAEPAPVIETEPEAAPGAVAVEDESSEAANDSGSPEPATEDEADTEPEESEDDAETEGDAEAGDDSEAEDDVEAEDDAETEDDAEDESGADESAADQSGNTADSGGASTGTGTQDKPSKRSAPQKRRRGRGHR